MLTARRPVTATVLMAALVVLAAACGGSQEDEVAVPVVKDDAAEAKRDVQGLVEGYADRLLSAADAGSYTLDKVLDVSASKTVGTACTPRWAHRLLNHDGTPPAVEATDAGGTIRFGDSTVEVEVVGRRVFHLGGECGRDLPKQVRLALPTPEAKGLEAQPAEESAATNDSTDNSPPPPESSTQDPPPPPDPEPVVQPEPEPEPGAPDAPDAPDAPETQAPETFLDGPEQTVLTPAEYDTDLGQAAVLLRVIWDYAEKTDDELSGPEAIEVYTMLSLGLQTMAADLESVEVPDERAKAHAALIDGLQLLADELTAAAECEQGRPKKCRQRSELNEQWRTKFETVSKITEVTLPPL